MNNNLIHLYRGSRILYGFAQSYVQNRLNMLGPLHKLAVSVTGQCNSRCITCHIWRDKPDRDKEVSLKDFETFVRSKLYRNARVIIVTGGEPFMRKDIADVIDILSRNTNGMVSVITNGLLSGRIIDTVEEIRRRKSKIDKISLSLNGKPDTHDITRGVRGSYEKVMETLTALKEQKVYTSLVFTITPENYDQIEWAYDLSKALGVDINFYPEISACRFGNMGNNRCFTEEQKEKILRYIQNIYRHRNYYYFDDSSLYYLNKVFRNEEVCRCYGGLQSAFINWDGEVYACEGFHDRKFSFGSIKDEGIDSLWKSDRAFNMRKYVGENRCQPCFLACEILSSLRKEIFTVGHYALKRRIFKEVRF